MTSIVLPDDSQHLTILGRNGTGKTIGANWNLSMRSWDRMPWTIIDYKRDKFFSKLLKLGIAKLIRADQEPPRTPGLYVMRPIPGTDDEKVNAYLMKVWTRGKHGLYFDEGYMVAHLAAMTPIYTQGRSKRIPIIALYQRPVYMSRFAISEATFFMLYDIHDLRDRKTIIQYVPPYDGVRLEKYHSLYYNVHANEAVILKPVPDEKKLIETFRKRHQEHFGSRWL